MKRHQPPEGHQAPARCSARARKSDDRSGHALFLSRCSSETRCLGIQRTGDAHRLGVQVAHGCFDSVKEHNRVKSLILGAGRDIVPSQSGEEAFKLLLAGCMRWEFFNKIAIAPEPGAIDLFGAQGQMFAPDDLAGALQSLLRVHRPRFIDDFQYTNSCSYIDR